jgi:hypothetical protein
MKPLGKTPSYHHFTKYMYQKQKIWHTFQPNTIPGRARLTSSQSHLPRLCTKSKYFPLQSPSWEVQPRNYISFIRSYPILSYLIPSHLIIYHHLSSSFSPSKPLLMGHNPTSLIYTPSIRLLSSIYLPSPSFPPPESLESKLTSQIYIKVQWLMEKQIGS